jgi:hypothetical protein
MKKRIDTLMKLALSLALIFVITSGCEDDGNTDIGNISDLSSLDRDDPDSIKTALKITPGVASISSIGDKIAFSVSGGTAPYTWSVGSTTAGNVNPTTSPMAHDGVIYTAAAKLANTITVTDKIGRTADAKVNGSSGSMTISPVSKQINDTAGTQHDFTVANGSGTITWTSSDPALGSIAVETATTGRFTVAGTADPLIGAGVGQSASATITITAVDSLNVSATATITMIE